jgi:hypothetical protein
MNTYLRTHHIIRLIDGIRVIAPGALNSSAARDFLVAHRDQSAASAHKMGAFNEGEHRDRMHPG